MSGGVEDVEGVGAGEEGGVDAGAEGAGGAGRAEAAGRGGIWDDGLIARRARGGGGDRRRSGAGEQGGGGEAGIEAGEVRSGGGGGAGGEGSWGEGGGEGRGKGRAEGREGAGGGSGSGGGAGAGECEGASGGARGKAYLGAGYGAYGGGEGEACGDGRAGAYGGSGEGDGVYEAVLGGTGAGACGRAPEGRGGAKAWGCGGLGGDDGGGSWFGERRGAGEGAAPRLAALRELIGLSRARLDGRVLADAGRVLTAADERSGLSAEHTVVAIAGATGSGKSSLFNALAGAERSEAGARRPTTAQPVACVWEGGEPGAEGLLERLGIAPRHRYVPADSDTALRGLVLLDLPDHDSAAAGHREHVERALELVDAVIWVVDPEKYADAVLHERYLRPLAGYAEVTFVVLNQVDRLPGDAADQVVDDLRRLLDEDGLALGEHGEPGAAVLALSAATGEGVGELREALGQFVAERGAAERRLAADVDAAAARLRPVYVGEGRAGLTERAREEFEDRLAEAVGAQAAGRAAERDWLRHADRACGAPWLRARDRYVARRAGGRGTGASAAGWAATRGWGTVAGGAGGAVRGAAVRSPVDARAAARPVVEAAVRAVAGEAARGLPGPWAQAVREAAERGADGLPEALDRVAAGADGELRAGPQLRPRWWTVAAAVQGMLLMLQLAGLVWVLGVAAGLSGAAGWLPALLVAAVGTAGGPGLAWVCAVAARGPARRYGQEAERRLRGAAAACGRARVLEPVAAELLRYREVRERYAVVAGW